MFYKTNFSRISLFFFMSLAAMAICDGKTMISKKYLERIGNSS